MYHKQVKEKKDVLKGELENDVMKKYGGGEHSKGVNPELLFAQTEEYREYAPDGSVVKGQEVATTKSKYEEDIFPGNHKSVFGSYWFNGKWGYQCCHNLVKNSYCTGEAGKANSEEAREKARKEREEAEDKEEEEMKKREEEEEEEEKKKKKKSKKRKHCSSSDEDSEEEERKKKKKKTRKREEDDADAELDERNRPYNSMHNVAEPTEEELENYHMTRKRWEDPMADFKDED